MPNQSFNNGVSVPEIDRLEYFSATFILIVELVAHFTLALIGIFTLADSVMSQIMSCFSMSLLFFLLPAMFMVLALTQLGKGKILA